MTGSENPRELEKFADLVERTVVTSKENKQISDLKGDLICYCARENSPISTQPVPQTD